MGGHTAIPLDEPKTCVASADRVQSAAHSGTPDKPGHANNPVSTLHEEKKPTRPGMKYNLPGRVLKDLRTFAQACDVRKVILFGSRARGDHRERSDVDIAIEGGDFDSFWWKVKEEIHSLLSFDVVEYPRSVSDSLKKEIQKDGIVIYEQA